VSDYNDVNNASSCGLASTIRMKPPKVTVLMPVYNGADFLRQAIDSILRQSYRDFELLVVNDGSTDSSREVLKSYSDPRLILAENERNLGLIATLNRGLELARGEFVARMDQDDVSLPRRLEVQQAYLCKHPEVGLCGTWFRTMGEGKSRVVRPPSAPLSVAAHAFTYCPIAHPSVMMRAALFSKFALRYDTNAPHAEDYDLWVRASRHFSLANVPKVLLHYRMHGEHGSTTESRVQADTTRSIRVRQLLNLYQEASAEQQDWHLRICELSIPRDSVSLIRSRGWLDLLRERNNEKRIYQPTAFGGALCRIWYGLCLHVALDDPRSWRNYFSRMYGGCSIEAFSFHARALARSFFNI
jgi:glycosyltransferase involved in cell wall biosynthesis